MLPCCGFGSFVLFDSWFMVRCLGLLECLFCVVELVFLRFLYLCGLGLASLVGLFGLLWVFAVSVDWLGVLRCWLGLGCCFAVLFV